MLGIARNDEPFPWIADKENLRARTLSEIDAQIRGAVDTYTSAIAIPPRSGRDGIHNAGAIGESNRPLRRQLLAIAPRHEVFSGAPPYQRTGRWKRLESYDADQSH